MDKEILVTAPTSPLAKVIAYAKARWAGFSAYAMHGQIEIDNNLIENAIRPLAITRKTFCSADHTRRQK
ncbi:MAG: transposase [Bacteroidota bacterium]|nr:transposase [Bacteroidota bacterium]